MKITKLGHSCLLVEMPAPVNRTLLIDPGIYSDVYVEDLEFLDDIVITHEHADHCDTDLLKQLVNKFPEVRVKTPSSMVDKLEGVSVTTDLVDGIELFDAKHEGHSPFLSPPENIGIHYLDSLSHPGDSHSFLTTRDILALPVTAPWGSTDRAVELALQLKPKHILPIHDWHWKDEVRTEMYERLEVLFKSYDIIFHPLENNKAIVIDI